MALIRWEPARELGTIQNEMNRLFNTFFDTPTAGQGNGSAGDAGSRPWTWLRPRASSSSPQTFPA